MNAAVIIKRLLESSLLNLELFAVTLLLGLPLGLVISFGSMSKWAPFRFLTYRQSSPGTFTRWLANLRPISFITQIFVWIIRGTPLMLQILIVYYGPGLIWGADAMGRMDAAMVAFVINYACYFSEIYRGGIQGIPQGQEEAGLVLGMTPGQIFFRVKLLQMIKRIVPPISNEIITLVKDTSLARIISLQEIIWAGQAFMKGSQGISGAIWPLFFTGVYYLVWNGVMSWGLGRLEKKLDYFK